MKALTKVSVLMIIGIFTTFIYLLIMIPIGLSSFNYIDTFANLVCIILMNKINEVYYNYTCGCCHKMMYKICIFCIQKMKSNDNSNSETNQLNIVL